MYVDALRILLVEDEPLAALAATRLLSTAGAQVHWSATANDALPRVVPGAFHVVLLDFFMPGSSAPEVIERMMAADPQCLLIVITGQGTIDVAVAAMESGAAGFLTKPYKLDELKHTIEKARSRRARELLASHARFADAEAQSSISIRAPIDPTRGETTRQPAPHSNVDAAIEAPIDDAVSARPCPHCTALAMRLALLPERLQRYARLIQRAFAEADRPKLFARLDAGERLAMLSSRARHGDAIIPAFARALDVDERTLRDCMRVAAAWHGQEGRAAIGRTNCHGETLSMALLLKIARVEDEDERKALMDLAISHGYDLREIAAVIEARGSMKKAKKERG
jgi:FixJ family two-component response regulator